MMHIALRGLMINDAARCKMQVSRQAKETPDKKVILSAVAVFVFTFINNFVFQDTDKTLITSSKNVQI